MTQRTKNLLYYKELSGRCTSLGGLGRAVKVQTGFGSTVVAEVDTTYAPCACGPIGKMSWQSQPYAPGGSTPGTTYTYDALGRTINVLLADGASHTQYVYKGNVTTVTDPAGKWKQYFSDAFGNLVTANRAGPDGQSYRCGPQSAAGLPGQQRA